MAEHFSTTYIEASKFARQIAREKNKPVKVMRGGDKFIVCIDASLTPASIEQSEPIKNRSKHSSTQATSVSGWRNVHSAQPPIAPQKAKKKENLVGLSAAAAKRSSSKKTKRIFDPSSIFITEDIEPKEISGGLPSLGKRK